MRKKVDDEEEQQKQKAREEEQRAKEEEKRQKEKEEEKRQKEKEDEKRQKEKEKEEKEEKEREVIRRKQELAEREEEAVQRARRKARRPLNAFEERRVRRQVRSELTGGGPKPEQQTQGDWFKPLRPEVKGQLDDAIKFFSDTMRVPATIMGSAALGMLFLPPFKWAFLKEEEQDMRFVAAWRLYVLFSAFTLCAQLTVLLGTSNAHAQLLELGRNGLALEPTAMDLIMSHLEFEYLTCSLNFFGGVVAFMLAVFCRVVAVFKYAKSRRMPQEPELCTAVGFMMLSSLLWWLHLANVRLMEFQNLGDMLFRYFQLLVARIRIGEVGLVGSSALVLSFVSLAVALRLFLAPLLQRPARGKAEVA